MEDNKTYWSKSAAQLLFGPFLFLVMVAAFLTCKTSDTLLQAEAPFQPGHGERGHGEGPFHLGGGGGHHLDPYRGDPLPLYPDLEPGPRGKVGISF